MPAITLLFSIFSTNQNRQINLGTMPTSLEAEVGDVTGKHRRITIMPDSVKTGSKTQSLGAFMRFPLFIKNCLG